MRTASKVLFGALASCVASWDRDPRETLDTVVGDLLKEKIAFKVAAEWPDRSLDLARVVASNYDAIVVESEGEFGVIATEGLIAFKIVLDNPDKDLDADEPDTDADDADDDSTDDDDDDADLA